MTKAYHPRVSTIHLANAMASLPGVSQVQIIAPSRGKGAKLVVEFDNGAKIDFSIKTAQIWVKAQKG